MSSIFCRNVILLNSFFPLKSIKHGVRRLHIRPKFKCQEINEFCTCIPRCMLTIITNLSPSIWLNSSCHFLYTGQTCDFSLWCFLANMNFFDGIIGLILSNNCTRWCKLDIFFEFYMTSNWFWCLINPCMLQLKKIKNLEDQIFIIKPIVSNLANLYNV